MRVFLRISCLCLLAAATACQVLNLDAPAADDEAALQPGPKFPETDRVHGHEGWVLVSYTVSSSGLVSEPEVVASSGRSSFERAALRAIREWRYRPGEQRRLSVIVVFELEGKALRVSHRFRNLYAETHELIDAGDLDAAEALLDEERGKTRSPYEIAYIYLAKGRIAGQRADHAQQLLYFRQAMMHRGRWLSPGNYLACLRAAVILAIVEEDYASAVRDYELLASAADGSGNYSDLEDSINAIRTRLQLEDSAAEPFALASSIVAVTRERSLRQPVSIGEAPPSRPGYAPPVRQPRERR